LQPAEHHQGHQGLIGRRKRRGRRQRCSTHRPAIGGDGHMITPERNHVQITDDILQRIDQDVGNRRGQAR
jgi:hypothetical protein